MRNIRYVIDNDVFTRFPDYARGVVLINGVKNGNSPDEVIEMLRIAEASVRERLTLEQLTSHPNIVSWREAFRSLGIKPSEFRSSIEAMTRRALRCQELPSINTLVDIGNIISLRYLIPTGGHAIDKVEHDISLRLATGREEFIPFGGGEVEHPDVGEIIFTEGNIVLTRRWSWRQSNHTLTLPETTAIEFNVDGLPPVTKTEVEKICQELLGMVQKYCGGDGSYQILCRENPFLILK